MAKQNKPNTPTERRPILLSGGNPRIPKADGDTPVQAYIAAMPGWKRAIGKRLDALVMRHVPNVQKAVKWNSPMYGIEGQGMFVSFHTFTHYVKVTFFRGTSLRPAPPGGTGQDARWIDVHENDLDEAQMTAWVKQAAALPGWIPGQPARLARTPTRAARAKPAARATATPASQSVSRVRAWPVRDVEGWRGEILARMRALIFDADPEMIEERKWIKPTNPLGVPVWSHTGIVCTGETYAKVVKLTFAKGASLPDPSHLFNASLEGNVRRAIDIREGETIDAGAFKALIRAAVAANNPQPKKQ